VQVRVGNLTFDLGYVEYQQQDSSLPEIIMISVIVGAVCLVIVIVVIARVVRSKRRVDRVNRMLLKELTAQRQPRTD